MDKLRYLLCSIFIFIAIVISSSKVYANEGILNGVIITDSKNSGYEITLNTTKAASFIQKNISNDKILIKVKGLKTSKNAATIYQNASNIEHIMIKPVFNGTVIEINGKNAAKSNIILTNGIAKTQLHPTTIIIIMLASIIAIVLKRRKRSNFSTKISTVDEENKILKVAFERKGGLIAKGTGVKRMPVQTTNVRKVKFMEDITIKELNIK